MSEARLDIETLVKLVINQIGLKNQSIMLLYINPFLYDALDVYFFNQMLKNNKLPIVVKLGSCFDWPCYYTYDKQEMCDEYNGPIEILQPISAINEVNFDFFNKSPGVYGLLE